MSEAATTTTTVLKVKVPTMWKVTLHNDDFTPLEFVVELLQAVFNKSSDEALVIANHVHTSGKAQIGLYTKEIATTKAALAQQIAEDYEHPLLTTAEEA